VEFDPTAAEVLKDPKYATLDEAARAEQALSIHQNRLVRLMQRLAAPVKLAVARDFLAKQWITKEQHTTGH
jgi:hypothetical protein